MGLASKYLDQLDNVLNSIKSDISKLSCKQSEYDKRINEIYHKLETAKFNACEGYYISKELQEVLRKRRLVKQQLFQINDIANVLKVKDLDCRLPKAKKNIKKSNALGKDWIDKFGFNFDDIEKEILN